MKEVIMNYPNAVVTIQIPELSKEERSRRMKVLKGAAQGLLMDSIRARRENINDKDIKELER